MKTNNKIRNENDWIKVFAKAKNGHILWDGNAADPSNPKYAIASANTFVNHGKFLGFFQDKAKILDLGCGNGRLAIPFAQKDVQYEGVEPMIECINFCKEAFAGYDHLKFHHVPVNSPEYGLSGGIEMENFTLSYDDQYFDDIICYSVFTHLKTLPIAQRYMQEIKRVLKPNGNFFVSFYRSPPNKTADPYIGRTIYNEWDIMSMLNGFDVLFSYGGHTDHYYDQWGLFCRRNSNK
jgi:SAM-dependent methyltransferase